MGKLRRNHKRPTSGPSSLLPLIGALNSQQRFTKVSFHFPHHVQCPKTPKNVLDHLMVETDDNDAHFGSGWASEPPTWPGHGARQCPLPRSSCVLFSSSPSIVLPGNTPLRSTYTNTSSIGSPLTSSGNLGHPLSYPHHLHLPYWVRQPCLGVDH